MSRPVVISLCDLTGNFVQPWVEAGHDAILVDPQHGFSHSDGRVTRLALTVECRSLGQLSGAPWFVENPASALSRVFGPADHAFHPHEFTALEPGDNYTKRTCLWTGGGFVMPAPRPDLTLGPPDDRIHKAPPSAGRGNFRSATPMGFARAVFVANVRTAKAAA